MYVLEEHLIIIIRVGVAYLIETFIVRGGFGERRFGTFHVLARAQVNELGRCVGRIADVLVDTVRVGVIGRDGPDAVLARRQQTPVLTILR